MQRWPVILVALAACKGKDLGPVHDGISRVDVSTGRGYERAEHHIEVSFTARVPQPLPGSYNLSVRAACQVGVDRLIDDTPTNATLVPGNEIELKASPYLIHPLPADPSLCELTFIEEGHGDPRELGRVCWDGSKVTEAPCPPNNISHVGVGPTGITAVLESVTPEDADDIGFPAHLTVRYRATAHRDMPKGSYFVRMTSCPGGYRSDDTWHSELGGMRAGESMFAGQNTYKLGRPKAGTPCETVFGYSPQVNGEITEISTFCHKDTAITPGECPR